MDRGSVVVGMGVDWATWSKPRCLKDFDAVVDEVLCQFTTQGQKAFAGHGYRGLDVAGYGCCGWRGADILVNLPARALEFARHFLKIPDQAMCRWFVERGFRATRIDAALDTTDEKFNPFVALMAWHQGLVRCDAEKCDFRLSCLEPGKPLLPPDGRGMTTYIGSPQGQRRMRVYDKLTEKLDKTGEIATDENGNELPRLTRIELQYRGRAARSAAQKIASGGIGGIPKLIAGYVTFLEGTDERCKRRKAPADWWQRIVGTEREALELMRGTATPDDAICWIERQAVQTLKLIRREAPDVWKRLLEEKLDDCEVQPVKAKQWEAWAKARAERQKERAEIERFEREEAVLAEIERASRDAAPTEATQ
jgi:hypothetical protein